MPVAQQHAPPADPTHTILVVDDSEDLRKLLKFALESLGYRVIEAIDGVSAINSARESRPDLVLMDLSMPQLDGYGAVRLIRNDLQIAKIPVIAMSAHCSEDHRLKAMAVGFDNFLTKPLDFNELDLTLDRYFNPEHAH